jgi:2OG-Fe(II) oxygenase superfamily
LQADQPIDEDTLEEWTQILCQQIDEILYSEEDHSLSQPILLSLTHNDEESSPSVNNLKSLVASQIIDYGLVDSIMENHEESKFVPFEGKYVPSLWYEVDGATVVDNNNNKKEEVWDTSSILVFDDLVSPELRADLLQSLGSGKGWDDANGPDPSCWEGVCWSEEEDEEPCAPDADPILYCLTEDALEELCDDSPAPTAVQQFEKILTQLFPAYTVTRFPESVLGASVTPLNANAPCFGQSFEDHIDADPYFAPPSPWTDVYGRYANRCRGKPRFVSCLIYLNDEWKEEWGAPTRIYDVASGTAVDITPKPGRVVIMDQDITHTVVAPLEAAGKRPRYSLVWKLILHPKEHDQDMRNIAGSHKDWPQPTYVGSAKR